MQREEVRHRIELPRDYVQKIARRCGCSESYVSKVLAGRINQRHSDLQRKITRVAMSYIDNE